jgi:hypothetical protein
MTFDHSDAGLPFLSQEFGLLFSPTNAFDFSFISFNGTVDGDQVSFDVSAGALQDGYYTLGIIPEPTTLLIWSLLAGLGFGLGWRRCQCGS